MSYKLNLFFFFNDTATTEIYTLSLHDALPILKKDLHLAAIRAPDPGAKQHVGLPDLIAVFGFKLLMRLRREQLPFREAALFEETIQRGSGERGRVLAGRQGQDRKSVV